MSKIEITTVPLSKLVPSKSNVRRFQSEAGLTELCASIRSHGLLQNLTVRKNDKGKYEVVAGARRLAALSALAREEGGPITKHTPIPVHLLDAQNDTEVSLAENTVRENMHVADQVEAFRKLIEDEGMIPENVGDRFGISHMTVRRRVKLAKISPRIMDEFRVGGATLQQMEALAVADDHAAQEDAFFGQPEYNRAAHHLRQRLTSEKLRADHRFVEFIGLDAYLAAGGTLTQDLFSEDDERYLDNKGLVIRLVSDRMEAAAGEVQAEGWKWSEFYLSDQDRYDHLPVIDSFKREHTDAESAEVADIMAFVTGHEAAYEAGQMTDDEQTEYELKLARMDEIDAMCIGYAPDEMIFAGVRVILNHYGEIKIRRGLVKKEDQHDLAAFRRSQLQAATPGDEEGDAYPETGEIYSPPSPIEAEPSEGYSAALTEDLMHVRTAALAYEVSERPEIGLALAVHTLGLRSLYLSPSHGYGYTADQTCIRINAAKQERTLNTQDDDNMAVFFARREQREKLQAFLPGERADFFDWCMTADQATLLKLLTFCIADQIDGAASSANATNARQADKIAEVIGLDMSKWWKPSDGFFKRITKKMISAAASEAGVAREVVSGILDAPKADAIRIAGDAMEGKGWVPPFLRTRPVAAPSLSVAANDDAAALVIAAE